MKRVRVIPLLLLKEGGLVKTKKFSKPVYIGDPINAVRIFNEKEVDELIFLDISATPEGRGPDFELVRNIAEECFMPLCYGGGIRTMEQVRQAFGSGVEKIALNTAAWEHPELIAEAAKEFGSQAVVVSIDVKKNWIGRNQVLNTSGRYNPVDAAKFAEANGAGEILLTSVDREGSGEGYDIGLIASVSEAVNIPVIAAGGASGISDFRQAVLDGGASAVAAGSLFVFHGPHKAVLINFPTQEVLKRDFYGRI